MASTQWIRRDVSDLGSRLAGVEHPSQLGELGHPAWQPGPCFPPGWDMGGVIAQETDTVKRRPGSKINVHNSWWFSAFFLTPTPPEGLGG